MKLQRYINEAKDPYNMEAVVIFCTMTAEVVGVAKNFRNAREQSYLHWAKGTDDCRGFTFVKYDGIRIVKKDYYIPKKGDFDF